MGVVTIGCDRSNRSSQHVHCGMGKAYFGMGFGATPCAENDHIGWPRLTLRGEVALKACGAGGLHGEISVQKKAYREVG